MLNDAASSILESDPDEDLTEFLNTVNERFNNLETEVSRKRDFFGDLVQRWNKFSDKKRRISELFRGTSCLIVRKQIRSTDEVREQLVQCQEAIVQLQNKEPNLSEVAEEGGRLITELRNEGMNVDKMERELHTVVNRYNEMKNRALKKEEVLQHVSEEMEKIDEGKMELESWLTSVHQQLNSVDEVETVSQAIQHEVLVKHSLIRSVSAQVLKLQATSNEEAELDLTEMLQPLHVQWRSLQNLVNLPNSSLESEQNIPSRWKSYSQDDLGSLDTFSEDLGLSRDDVMESGGDLMYEDYHDALGDLENWINRFNEFRECLHGYVYCPEDTLFEVEQKLNIVQTVGSHVCLWCEFTNSIYLYWTALSLLNCSFQRSNKGYHLLIQRYYRTKLEYQEQALQCKSQNSIFKCQSSVFKCQSSVFKCQNSLFKCQGSVFKCQNSVFKRQNSVFKCQNSVFGLIYEE